MLLYIRFFWGIQFTSRGFALQSRVLLCEAAFVTLYFFGAFLWNLLFMVLVSEFFKKNKKKIIVLLRVERTDYLINRHTNIHIHRKNASFDVYEIVSLRDYTWGDATKHLGQLMYAFHRLAAYILHRLLFAGKFSNLSISIIDW